MEVDLDGKYQAGEVNGDIFQPHVDNRREGKPPRLMGFFLWICRFPAIPTQTFRDFRCFILGCFLVICIYPLDVELRAGEPETNQDSPALTLSFSVDLGKKNQGLRRLRMVRKMGCHICPFPMLAPWFS